MASRRKGQASTAIDDEAVTWFVLLRDAALATRDRARFAAWLAADPRHRQAWQEVEELWTGMDGLRPAGSDTLRSGQDRGRGRAGASRGGVWQRLAAVAATLLLMVGAAGFWALVPPSFGAALFADHHTTAAERRTVRLADGSTVVLGASSALSVEFAPGARRVVLHHGEGFFSVVPDPARPFAVASAGGVTTALGTAFDVKLSGRRVGVAVASGTVEVAVGTSQSTRLTSGWGMRYGADGVGPPQAVDPADVGFWRKGRLIFQAAPLGEVLHDLERYRGGRILVTDAALAALPVTGVFDASQPDPALDTIARTLPVQLLRLTDLLVLVRPAG